MKSKPCINPLRFAVLAGKGKAKSECIDLTRNSELGILCSKSGASTELKELLFGAVPKDEKVALFFSGGIDSLLTAKILKDAGKDFICYTIGTKNSQDIIHARKAAKLLNLKLRTKIISEKQTGGAIKKIIEITQTANPVKVGISLPIYFACQLAKKDKIKTVMTGTGADEIFAGYNRYKSCKDVNLECRKDTENIEKQNVFLKNIFDYFGLQHFSLFLDKNVINFGLQLSPEYKIKNGVEKYILRELAVDLEIPEELAFRKKKGAQYGSGFDQVLEKISKHKKTEYLKQFLPKLGALISGGKDSLFGMYKMRNEGYEIACVLTVKSENPYSYMFHTPNTDLVKLQAEAMGIPLITKSTAGEKEKELKDLEKLLRTAKQKYKIEGVITGALYSVYQTSRIQKVCKKLKLKVFSPLWHMNQEEELREILNSNFEIIFTAIAAYGLDKSWLERKITQKDIDKLVELNKKYGINIAGEGGEMESLVLDCPMFTKRLEILDSKIIEENENSAKLIVKKAKLI